MSLHFKAHIPGELRYRDVACAWVRAACKHIESDRACHGLEWRVVSAFNEAFNNIIEHAYATIRGEIVLTLCVNSEAVILSIADDGSPFDFERAGATTVPPVDGLDAGGMGLFIMRQVMSEVRYQRLDGHNLLTLTKRLCECPQIPTEASTT
jgi:anti-sigma regulatory factor (Ser/Thr protein kinase)